MGRRSVWSDQRVLEACASFVPAADEVWRLQRDDDPECRWFREAVRGSSDQVAGSMQGTDGLSKAGDMERRYRPSVLVGNRVQEMTPGQTATYLRGIVNPHLRALSKELGGLILVEEAKTLAAAAQKELKEHSEEKKDGRAKAALRAQTEVYDALAEARSYKPAWPVEKIVALFRAEAGTHFDPELAKLVADGLERKGSRFFSQSPDTLF